MSLDFNSAGSNRSVNHGSAAALDDLPNSGNFSVWAWVYRQVTSGNQLIVAKMATFPNGWMLLGDGSDGGESLRLYCGRATAGLNYTSTTAAGMPIDTWAFIAGTYDSAGGAGTLARLYRGTLIATVAECAYSAQTDGSGAFTSDAGANLIFGNYGPLNAPFRGRGARAGVVNRTLSLGELRAIQHATIPQCNLNGTVLLAAYNDASKTQPDVSGNGNNGTVTSATDAPGLPLGATYMTDWGRSTSPQSSGPSPKCWFDEELELAA